MICEEDRVQWHRALAEMMRWLEEIEVKQIEFLRCTRYFDYLRQIWESIAGGERRPGYAAYARKQQATYSSLYNDALYRCRKVVDPKIVGSQNGTQLVAAVNDHRSNELEWFFSACGSPTE